MRLFIISGKSGTGKNELANMIKEYYEVKNEKSLITEYSKYVKIMAREALNWDGTREHKPRKFLQDMGQVFRATLGEDIFIKRMQEDIQVYSQYYDNIIISDARLKKELNMMKEKYSECYTIHLTSNIKNSLTLVEQNHITETELDNYNMVDYQLDSSDLNKLKISIENILEVIK